MKLTGLVVLLFVAGLCRAGEPLLYLEMVQTLDNAAVSETNQPVTVIVPVESLDDATNQIVVLASDPDYFGVPPNELAFVAKVHAHKHGVDKDGNPTAVVSCDVQEVATHQSDHKGQKQYVVIENDEPDPRKLTIKYVLRCKNHGQAMLLLGKVRIAHPDKDMKVKKEKF